MKTYTLTVTLVESDRLSRQLQLEATQTLGDLHAAIQRSLNWQPDDHMYFEVFDEDDEITEYVLDIDEECEGCEEDEDLDAELQAQLDQLPPLEYGDHPTPQTLQEALAMMETNPSVRAQVKQTMTEQLGIPSFLVDAVLNNARALFEHMEMDEDEMDDNQMGDAATTTLDALNLLPDDFFYYTFGDWEFEVHVEEINEDADASQTYPLEREGYGSAPGQYDPRTEEWF